MRSNFLVLGSIVTLVTTVLCSTTLSSSSPSATTTPTVAPTDPPWGSCHWAAFTGNMSAALRAFGSGMAGVGLTLGAKVSNVSVEGWHWLNASFHSLTSNHTRRRRDLGPLGDSYGKALYELAYHIKACNTSADPVFCWKCLSRVRTEQRVWCHAPVAKAQSLALAVVWISAITTLACWLCARNHWCAALMLLVLVFLPLAEGRAAPHRCTELACEGPKAIRELPFSQRVLHPLSTVSLFVSAVAILTGLILRRRVQGLCNFFVACLLFWLTCPGGEASLLAGRACDNGAQSTLFSNCCTQEDVHWCTDWVCWTKLGCVVCTAADGCWTPFGSGVSMRPGAHSNQARRDTMNVFGAIGLTAYVAEAFGLGELYAAGLVMGIFSVGGHADLPLVCNVSCSADSASWFRLKSPTVSEIITWVQVLPNAVWSMLTAMPIVFAVLLGYTFLRGHIVIGILLFIGVPGVLADCERGAETHQCNMTELSQPNCTCLCPFGVFYKRYDREDYKAIPLVCPQRLPVPNMWVCAWGSWWWVAKDVETPYSHPLLPPVPYSAICYISDSTVYYGNKTFDISEDGDGLGGNTTTCLLDRRDEGCGDCWGGCYAADRDNSRPYERCGGGYLDGSIQFVPLGVIRWTNSSTDHWWRPTRSMAELLISGKYRTGYGCGLINGVVHCWNCSIGDSKMPEHGWYPQPGKPTDLCINPAYERRQMVPPTNWLALLQYMSDAMTAGVGCPTYDVPAYPVCQGMAWFPTDGSRVIMSGARQVLYPLPDSRLGFVGLYAVLVCFMVLSGARIVPILLIIVGVATNINAACYPPCSACTFYFCFSWTPCFLTVGNSSYIPVSTFLSAKYTADLPEGVEAMVPVATVVEWLCHMAGLPGMAGVFMTTVAMTPVAVDGTADFYCGNASVPSFDIEGFEPIYILWFLVLPLTGTMLWNVGCGLGMAAGMRVRAVYPWRLVLLLLQSSSGHLLEFCIMACLALQAWDVVYARASWFGVEAALHRGVIAAPAFAAATRYPTWAECVLGVLCVIFYCRVVGRAGLAAIVAYKLSRGLLGVTALCLLLARDPSRSVLGEEVGGVLEVCIPVDWLTVSSGSAWWYVSGLFSCIIVTFSFLSPVGRMIKLRLYARWCRVYCSVRLAVSVSPCGRYGWLSSPTMLLWLGCCVAWPYECGTISIILVVAAGSIDIVDWALEALLCVSPRTEPLARAADLAAWACNNAELSALLQRWWWKGWVLYEHMGQVSDRLRERVEEMNGCLEPVVIRPETLRAVCDDTLTLTCGQWFGKEPVVARCGNMVLIGSAQSVRSLPPGYTLTAPLLVVRPKAGFFKVLKTSLLGRGGVPGSGQVVVLETATGMSMGVATSGVLYTTFHGTSGRPLAGPTGPRNPFWSSPSDDVACYPLLEGLSCLDPCSCGDHSRWVIRVDGQLVHATQSGDKHVVLDCPTPLDKIKGSSGSPVLCDKGHAVGMLVGAIASGGIVSKVRYVRPWTAVPGDATGVKTPEFPTVPADGFKCVSYVAPTGSGKSTKLPLSLAALGHRVLVLNPSVVTTKAMHKYIKKLSGKSPNTYAGTGKDSMSIKTGSKLTYMTYGRFLVDPETWLKSHDVVICDECHAVDGTSILGIGCALTDAEASKVKLLILATATPPGTVITPHASITEQPLDSTGDIPFYGLTLKSENYKTGRHVIFCHSKAECTRVSGELAKAGVNSTTFWRGANPANLSDDPNLTVVATDAISTGYTGNFASCTDCCSVVGEEVEVDLNPTFTLMLTTKPADAALRMQRRGRTGRGTPGVYRPVITGAPPTGMTSSAAAWSAAEAGYVWYGRTEQVISRYLEAYQASPYTCRMPGNPLEAVRAIGVLRPFFQDHEVASLALKDQSWPLLYGAQRSLCLRNDSAPPSDDIRWNGIRGENAVPLLYRLGNVTADCTGHQFATEIAKALGDTTYVDVSAGPLLLAGVAVAAAVAVVGATGCLTVSSVWEVHTGGSPCHNNSASTEDRGREQEGGPVPAEALREVAASLDFPFLTTVWGAIESGATLVSSGADNAVKAVTAWWTNGTPVVVPSIPAGPVGERVLEILNVHLMALAAGGLAIVGSRSSPALATVAALVAGVQTVLPPHATWMLAIAGGIAVTLASNPTTGAAAAAAFFMGTKIGSFSILNTAVACVTGYEACINTAALTLELMDGTANAMSWAGALVGLMSPGAAVAGLALALLLRGAMGSDMSVWINRLLSSLPRSNTLPDGFFAEKADPKLLSKAVRSLSLGSKLRAWCEASQKQDYVFCDSGWIGKLFKLVCDVYNYVRSWAADHLPTPKLPFVSCQLGYAGDVDGVGSVSSTCTCGAQLSWTVNHLQDTLGVISKGKKVWTCRNSILGRMPINTTTVWSGDLKPDASRATELTYLIGVSDHVVISTKNNQFRLIATNKGCVSEEAVKAAVRRGVVAIDGAPVSSFWRGPTSAEFTAGQSIVYNGVDAELPIKLSRLGQVVLTPYSFVDPGEAAEVRLAEAEKDATEAATLTHETVKLAGKMMAASFEARRKAEAEAWALREKMMGRDLFADGCDPDADDSPDHSATNRLLYALEDSTDDPHDVEAMEEALLDVLGPEPELPLSADKERRREIEVDEDESAPTPLSKEPILKATGSLELVDDVKQSVKEITEVSSYAASVVGNVARGAAHGASVVMETLAEPVAEAAAAATRLADTAKRTARKVASSVAKTVGKAPKLSDAFAEVTKEQHPILDITTMRTVCFNWSCGSGGSEWVNTSDADTFEDALSRTKAPKVHTHKMRQGLLEILPKLRVAGFSEPELKIDLICPKHPDVRPKGEMRVITLQHSCCGCDESRVKTVGTKTPVCLLDALWGDTNKGRWMCGDNDVPADAVMGDLGPVLNLVHETKCGLSYLWSGAPIVVGNPRKHPVTRPLTAHMGADATKVYVTDPEAIHDRIAKVTIEQTDAETDRYLLDAYNLALAKASKLSQPGYDYDTAVSKVRPGSARGHVADITVADLKTPKGKKAVLDCLAGIQDGTEEGRFMLRPKSEVFPKTRSTPKPPRLICYPSLEFRVAEKMILGDPAVVAKAVMGESYGFQHPPHKRAKVLYDMWRSKRQPVCYTVDGACFDSTITQADIRREAEVFARASTEPGLVRRLHAYYAESPMVGPDGRIVGIRRCRASGTLTTSAGNSITCYIKVTAACRKAGIVNPSFLIHGDDVVIICERQHADQSAELKAALASYGYACEPQQHADLSTAESCSATVTMVRTVRGMRPVLTTDMRRGLGRCLAEVGDPVGTAWGYIINYPTNPIVAFVLLPLLLSLALNSGNGVHQLINVDIRGNTLQMPLSSLGRAIRGLHGPDILAVTGRSPCDIEASASVLQFFGMRGLGHWRRNRQKVLTRLLRAGKDWATLGRELLWSPGSSAPPILTPGENVVPDEMWEWSWEGFAPVPPPARKRGWLTAVLYGLLCLLAVSFI
uniref:Genome polyprotein n=1 Tax=Bat pegivirus TaxID=1112699 RepID=N0A123_9FLAV|nr:polyprotein [Bat pegivirus]